MAIILGLDMGVSSIGWSLVDDSTQQIITNGSRIFQAGVNASPQGKEESKNAKRTGARQIRRQIFRKSIRKELLTSLFQHLKWFPVNEENLAELMNEDPYQLRKKALDEKISLPQLARIFYHLSKRRGFKSSRKGGGEEEGKLFEGMEGKKGINELQHALITGSFRTIGEYFASLNPHEIRIRNRYTLRQQYINEFDAIWNAQIGFHREALEEPLFHQFAIKQICKTTQQNKWLDKEFYHFLKDYVIYYQRPLKSQKGLVGHCTLETKFKKTPLSKLVFQEFRIWQKLHDIRITGNNKTDEPLSFDEKKILFTKLNTSKEQTIEQLLKLIGHQNDNANFKHDDKIKGNRTAHAMIAVFGKKPWEILSDEDKEKRWKLIYDAEDNAFLVKYGIEKWQLSAEDAEKLKKVNFEAGYAELSERAIKNILPIMANQNLDFAAACAEFGYHHSQKTNQNSITTLLDSPKNLRNPIVQQGLFELRSVINTLIKEYAIKLDIIRIELARELKMPKKDRENILSDNKRREREHDRIWNILKQDFSEFKNIDPKSDDIVKYKLYEECQHKCPYTGNSISTTALFSGAYEIEHIIPLSRSLDDSFQNKTLCERAFNLKKGNDTPFEMMQKGKISEADYDAILSRTKEFKKNGQFNYGKFKRFIQQKIDDKMVANQLNDTAYLSREAKAYLETICAKVQVSKGGATAKLRGLWGLNSILNKFELNIKNRDDHRHHALDALVVACTTPAMLQQLSRLNEKNIAVKEERFPKPWDNFRNDAKDALNDVLIAHRHKSRVRGKLHDETMYGKVKNMEGKQATDEAGKPFYKVKKPLASLSKAMIFKIAGPARQVVIDRLLQLGVQIDFKNEKVGDIPNNAFNEPLWMPNTKGMKIEIKKVTIHDVATNKIEIRKDTFVDSGSNHHIVIYQKPNGKRDGNVVSLFEATKRQKQGFAIINTDCGEGNDFVMSLSINEMILLDSPHFKTADIDWNHINRNELSENLYRVQKIDAILKNITFRHHLVAILIDTNKIEPGRFFANPNTLRGIKVKVNAIGEIKRI